MSPLMCCVRSSRAWQAATVNGKIRMADALCLVMRVVCGDVLVAHQPNKHAPPTHNKGSMITLGTKHCVMI